MGFSEVKTLFNTEASRDGIIEALDNCMALGPDDNLLIYYAGHGWMDPETRSGYWVPGEARQGKKSDYLANSQIMGDFLRKYRVKHLLVIADSCFGGSILRGQETERPSNWGLPEGYRKPSRWVLTSGDLAPVPDDTGAGNSPFAIRLVQFLKYSDTEAFGVLDVYTYLRKHLQNPQPCADRMAIEAHMAGGEFVFMRTKRPPPPPPPTNTPLSAKSRWVNSLGMEFVPAPDPNVRLCVWETRVKDFEAFVNDTGRDTGASMYTLNSEGWGIRDGRSWRNPGFKQTPDHPVVGASWSDAVAFCEWLTKKERKEGRLRAGQSYRPPTDAEWSVAVGLSEAPGGLPKDKDGQISDQYPWGRTWPPPKGAGNYAGVESRTPDTPPKWNVIEGYSDGYARTAPVGSFDPNQYGLFDLGGNAWEWCEDRYDNQHDYRVLRGGSWGYDLSGSLLSSFRFGDSPDVHRDYYGFRVVLAGPPR
jgi:hypothetical protein